MVLSKEEEEGGGYLKFNYFKRKNVHSMNLRHFFPVRKYENCAVICILGPSSASKAVFLLWHGLLNHGFLEGCRTVQTT